MLTGRRFVVAILAIVTLHCSVASGDWKQFKQRCKLDWQRNQAWPNPFVAQDRLAACSPFVTMTVNGWRDQCTLSNFHFDPESQQLTEVGRLRVQQILREHPEMYRNVFVVRGTTPEATTARVDSAQQFVNNLAGQETGSEVRLVELEPRGVTADDVQMISSKLKSSMPDPRLPASSSPAGSSTP
jgi:hypothetical protein